MVTATINTEIQADNSTQRNLAYFTYETQNYTSGGLIFTYPASLFATAPHVFISIQPIVSHTTDTTFTAEISSNSATSTTIMVYQLMTAAGVVSINEAPDNSVMVNLVAFDDPYIPA